MTDGFPVPGEVFEGRYRISALIGSGGFARVYSAVQEDLGRDVAIKILMPAHTSDGTQYSEKLVRRFNQEARLVSRLRDPHTITMFDYGETDGGLLYMVFEYIEGRSLSQIVHEDGALDASRVATVLEATLSSLQEAHAFGVLHRDIKPGNIMLFDYLDRPDQVKLLDFGIAKSLTTEQVPGKDITADGALVGTPRYMSPEQIRGRELGAASDIYSLGLVAYEMLTGHKAIDSNSSVTIIGRQLDSEPFRLPEEIEVSDGLRAIVQKMLAKDVERRYVSAEEVLKALRDWRSGKPPVVDHADFPLLDVEPLPLDDDGLDDSATSNPMRRRALIGLLLALLAAAAITVVSLGEEETGPGAEVPPPAASTVASAEERPAETMEDEPSVEETGKRPVLVATTPEIAMIQVDGVDKGESPARITVDPDSFPIEIRATIGDEFSDFTMDDYDEEFLIDVSELVWKARGKPEKEETSPSPPVAQNEAKSDDKQERKTKTKRERKPEIKPDPPQKEKENEKGSGELTLPPLDY